MKIRNALQIYPFQLHAQAIIAS